MQQGAFQLRQSLQCEYRGAAACSRALQRSRSISSCVEAPHGFSALAGGGGAASSGAPAPSLDAFDGLSCGRPGAGEAFACQSLVDGGCGSLSGSPLASIACSFGCARLRSWTRGDEQECALDVDVSSAYLFEPCDVRAMCLAAVEPSCALAGALEPGPDAAEGGAWASTWVQVAVIVPATCCLMLCAARLFVAARKRWGYDSGRRGSLKVGVDPDTAGGRYSESPPPKGGDLAGLVGAVPVDAGPSEVWEVVFPGSVNVRSARSVTAAKLTMLPRGSLLSGRQEGVWLALADEPGFVLISDGENSLLRRVDVGSRAEAVGLPEGWDCATDTTTGRTYYFEQRSGTSQWTRPAPAPSGPSRTVRPYAFGRVSTSD